jgi:hypothetical protein
MKLHCNTFHPSRFAAFNSLNTQEKKTFFRKTGKNTMLKMFSNPTKAESIYSTTRITIINVIVVELLLEHMLEEEENGIN